MGAWWGKIWSEHLKKPGGGFGGWMISKYLERFHPYLETHAVKLCEIKPDHTVLEVGFGPGIGLEAAFENIKDGTGSLHGVDISSQMAAAAEQRLGLAHKRKEEAESGKIQLQVCSVTDMPYDDNTFDRIFHVNCFYYWPEIDPAVEELYRVMKPGGIMVSTLNIWELEVGQNLGYIQNGDIDPDRYMDSLKKHGFINVFMKHDKTDERRSLQAIMATKPEK